MKGVSTVQMPDAYRIPDHGLSSADKATVAFVNGDIDMEELMRRLTGIARTEVNW